MPSLQVNVIAVTGGAAGTWTLQDGGAWPFATTAGFQVLCALLLPRVHINRLTQALMNLFEEPVA
jgi:hypothetical protein